MMAGARRGIVFGLLMAFSAMVLLLPAYSTDGQDMDSAAGGECRLCTCAKNFPPVLPSVRSCFTTTLVSSDRIDPEEPRASEGPVLLIRLGRSPPILFS